MELIQLNNLTDICGYSYSDDVNINNGYNCNHPDCDDYEYVKNDSIVDLTEEIRKYIINMIRGRKKRIRNKLIKKHWDTRNNYNDEYWTKKLRLKKVGKCYTFSCPIAHSTDLEDMKNIDKELYNEYKATGDDPEDSDWMIRFKE